MAKHWNYFMFLLWISYLIIAGIIMFTRGFLLRRDAFTETSSCIPYNSSNIPCTPGGSSSMNITNGHEYHCSTQEEDKLLSDDDDDINSASKLCPRKKAKVILLVIDALRYDFATYLPDIENPAPFQNKLPIIRDLLLNSNHSKLYKFIADPPTTTMQRLKALTTGGLPTFIDAGSNFATPEINEDNIIDQLLQQSQNITFMGDDTWNNLYPNRFVRHWPFPSFNVFDLDTVDSGIIDHIYEEIARPDWTLLIAHFLGVDHCGHRYGPNHQEMKRKLSEMNDVIKNVVNTMDKDTILFVIGDHGMTNTGDHGGETELEVTATLFIHSQIPLVSFETTSYINSVKQVDLIPTLSSILGIPIPYSNLGTLILDAFPATINANENVTHWQQALLALWTNVQQTTNYLKHYSQTSSQLNSEKLAVLKENYSKLNARVNHIKTEDEFKSFAQDVKEYFILARDTCAEVWIQFDSFSMSRGLLIVFLTIFFTYMISDGIPTNKLSDILASSFLLCSYTMMAIAFVISVVCFYFSLVDNLELTVFFSTGMVSIIMLAIVVIQNWETIAIHWYECTKLRKWIDFATRLILLFFISILFTNSYILEEAGVLSYLSLALVYFTIYNTILQSNPKSNDRLLFNSIKPKWSSFKTKLILLGLVIGVLIRASMIFWRCREEQKWCVNFSPGTDDLKKIGKNAEKVQCVITLVCLALLVTITRIWLRSCGNLVGFSSTVTLARYAPTVMVVCSAGFWILHRLPKENKSKLVAGWQVDILAWTVYALVALGILSIIVQPLCVYVLPKRKERVSVYGQENIIPQLFNQVKGLYDGGSRGADDLDDDAKNTPVVYGLGTVYSAAFVIFSIFVCLTIALLLGDGFAPSAVLMYFTAALVLATFAIAQYERATSIEQLFDVPSSSVLCWVILSHYFFYGTGHQPSFPLIHWEAAFVGTGGTFTYNIIPATLVGINTFGSYILFAIALPLLIIGPFTLYIMFPNLASNKFTAKDLRRGELILYEHDELLLRGMLSVACKYILFHGIRMFACMLAVTIHCRHLMVWGIFAPKLIFEGIALMVSFVCVAITFLLLIRINKKVNKLVVSLEKQNR